MKALLMAGALCVATVPAAAAEFSQQLGAVLGSEEACDLAIDQAALQTLIERRVKPNDLDFTADLELFTWDAANDVQKLSRSQMTARCVQVRRVAKSLGLLKP